LRFSEEREQARFAAIHHGIQASRFVWRVLASGTFLVFQPPNVAGAYCLPRVESPSEVSLSEKLDIRNCQCGAFRPNRGHKTQNCYEH
jgi:hypothetical protein